MTGPAAGLPGPLPAPPAGPGLVADDLSVAVVGPVPPVRCSVAEEAVWTAGALARAGAEVRLVAVDHPADDSAPGRRRPPVVPGPVEVAATWPGAAEGAERAALRAVDGCDAVVVHHHPTLLGTRDAAGSPLVRFLQRCPVPTVLVLHEVPTATDPASSSAVAQLVDLASTTVVHSEVARRRVVAAAGPGARVRTIPRAAVLGAPTTTPPRPAGQLVPEVLTFGFLDPDKSVEDGVVAIADLDDLSAPVHYTVAGPTATDVVDLEGEHYRSGLRILARALKVDDRVHVDDRYLPPTALAGFLQRSDVVLLPYVSPDVTSSAALVEALAAGVPVVATAFPHAVELLSDGAGILVSPGDRPAMTRAVRQVLTRPQTAAAMRARAAELGRQFDPGRVLVQLLQLVRELRQVHDLRPAAAAATERATA